jgi:DHA2 family multidrug resistance protein
MITISFDGLPPERIPSASGISNFARITGGAFAASIVTTMWDRREALHQSRMAETATAYAPAMRQTLDQLHHLGAGDLQSLGMVARTMGNQAYLLASDELFWLSGWLSLLTVGLVWLTRRPSGAQAAPAAAD